MAKLWASILGWCQMIEYLSTKLMQRVNATNWCHTNLYDF